MRAPTDPQRILVIGREHVGDIVNSTPYIRALQQRYSGARFTVDVGLGASGVLENFPGISEIWRRPTHEGAGGKLAYISKIRKGRFDMAVILDDSSRFILETKLAGVPLRYGVFRKRFKKLFTESVTWSREKHDLFDPFDELMRVLKVPISVSRPVMYPDQDDIERIRELLAAAGPIGMGLVALNASSGREYNRWRPERWAEMSDWLSGHGFRTVLIGPPTHVAENKAIVASCRRLPIDWTGALSLVQVFEALRRVKYLVSIDTGTVHIAAAAGTPTVILYGPTDPKRFYPYGNRWEAVREADEKMASIPTESVQSAFEALTKRFNT